MIYNFKLENNEKIKIISDDTLISIDNKILKVTIILTSHRLLILDYPSNFNSREDLRISRGINYIKQKEIKMSKKLKEITNLEKTKKECKIYFIDNSYIIIKDNIVAEKISKIL